MKYTWLDEYLLSKKGVHKDFKSEWNWDRYLIEDKMFVAVCYADDGKAVYITLKSTRLRAIIFVRNTRISFPVTT